jgi:norsolorinic acid ketoreductase
MVDTDMGRQGVASLGMSIEEVGGITAEASVTGLLAVIDVATKATHGGKFWNYTGERLTFWILETLRDRALVHDM